MHMMIKNSLPTLFGILLLLFACWLQITNLPQVRELRDRIDNVAYDIQLRSSMLGKSAKPDKTIAVVYIDDNSLKEQGRWPWPREKLARLNNNIQKLGAVIVAYDMFFPEPEANVINNVLIQLQQNKSNSQVLQAIKNIASDFDGDNKLQNSLQRLDAILGFTLHDISDFQAGFLPAPLMLLNDKFAQNTTLIRKKYYTSNIPSLQKAAKASGFINVFPDTDGLIRRVPLIMQYHNAVYASLSLSAVQVYLISKTQIIWQHIGNNWIASKVILGKQNIPIDEKGQVLIPFGSINGNFPRYSATDILEGRLAANSLAGKLVFVGVSGVGLGDLKSTVIDSSYPGVDIHAVIAQGILANNFRYIPYWAHTAQLLITIFLGCIFIWLFPRLSAGWLTAFAISVPVLLFILDKLLFVHSGIVFTTSIPMLMTIMLAIMNMAYGYLSEERRKKELREMFGQYVPPAYIEKLLQHHDSVESETKEMTVLFSDIRNFTTISESMSAAEIKALLNQFFDPMTRIIFEHHGTIDKYVGDMLMAFWGAPLSDPDHAHNALNAALEMRAMVAKLKQDFIAQGLPLIDIGIGINSGLMSVGDMGSHYRRAYTVIGDTVNLASRLETLTKTYGIAIIVGEKTQQLCKDAFVFRKIASVMVKGKLQPVIIFELVGKVENVS
jgi:adenylate cyclase